MNHQLSPQELAAILRVAIHAGQLMLQSGAASFRTNQVIDRVALAMGVERIESYVTPTVIMATLYSGYEHRTQIVKPNGLGVDMSRIYAIEHFSRNMPADPTCEQVMALLDSIEHLPPLYPRPVAVIAVGLACGAFAGILGGGLLEFTAAGVSAALAQAVRYRLIAARFNSLMNAVVCAAIATLISFILVRLTGASRVGVIASVLFLVPGVPLVTSLLDMTRFDLVSGLSRGLYATLVLICIGIGMLLVLAWTNFAIF